MKGHPNITNKDATKTDIRCPRAAEHHTEKNVHLLRYDHGGSYFCPVHGDVDPPSGLGEAHFNAQNGDIRATRAQDDSLAGRQRVRLPLLLRQGTEPLDQEAEHR